MLYSHSLAALASKQHQYQRESESMRRSHSSSDLTELSQQSSTPTCCDPPYRVSSIDVDVGTRAGDHEDRRVTMGLHSPHSQPIPITNSFITTQEVEENDSFVDASLHYEHATWRMYNRIITARHVRAVSRRFPNHHDKHMLMKFYCNGVLPPHHANAFHLEDVEVFHVQRNRQQPNEDTGSNFGVFILEM
jgi:hypothetical protein